MEKKDVKYLGEICERCGMRHCAGRFVADINVGVEDIRKAVRCDLTGFCGPPGPVGIEGKPLVTHEELRDMDVTQFCEACGFRDCVGKYRPDLAQNLPDRELFLPCLRLIPSGSFKPWNVRNPGRSSKPGQKRTPAYKPGRKIIKRRKAL